MKGCALKINIYIINDIKAKKIYLKKRLIKKPSKTQEQEDSQKKAGKDT